MASYVNNLWPNFFPAGGAGLPRIGPFQNGSDLYLFFRGGNNGWYITAWKSSDAGATWAEVDAAHHPEWQSDDLYECIQDGAIVRVIYCASGQLLGVIDFDMDSDTWGSVPGSFGPHAYTAFYGSSLAAALRSDGSLIIAYQDYGVAPDWDYRVRVVDWTAGGGWGTPQTVMTSAINNLYLIDGVLGPDDRFHIFGYIYVDDTTFHRSLSSANTLGTQQTILAGADNSGYSFSVRALRSGSTIYLPYQPNTEDSLRVLFGTSDVNPTWDTEEVTPNLACVFQEENSVGAMLIGGSPCLIWVKAAGGDPSIPDGLYYSRRSGTWSDTLIDADAYMPMPSAGVSGGYLFWSDVLSPAGWYYDTLAQIGARYRALP